MARFGVVCDVVYADVQLRFFCTDVGDEIQKHHLRGRFYEQEELSMLRSYIRQGDVIADIGSNVGNHAVFFAGVCGANKVICFEPSSAALDVLKINIALNSLTNVDLSNLGIALGKRSEKASLVTPASNLGGTRALVGSDGDITVIAGDSVLGGSNVSFMKIDVEGMEMEVLSGLAETIASQRPTLYVEVHEKNEREFAEWRLKNHYEIRQTRKRYASNVNYLVQPV